MRFLVGVKPKSHLPSHQMFELWRGKPESHFTSRKGREFDPPVGDRSAVDRSRVDPILEQDDP